MLKQELLVQILGTSVLPFRCDTVLAPLSALVAIKNPNYESLWEAANRICDRYLPKLKQE
jgi:hypothetical protein